MAAVELIGVTKLRRATRVLDGVSLAIGEGEFVCLLAPPNHGKTTLLRVIAGLERVDEGDVRIGGISVAKLPVQQRDVGMVFEDLAVFPHWSGFDNLAHPLKRAGVPKEEVASRVDAVARLLRIEGIIDRMPSTYSGGEMQRVAIGRAVIKRPAVLLMDEPLSSLDAMLRQEMSAELKRLQEEIGQTIVYATHDFEEAMTMGDRVVVFKHGRVEQEGPPEEVYERPASEHAALLMGSPQMNLLSCAVERDGPRLALRHPAFAIDASRWADRLDGLEFVHVGIRPERIRLAPAAGGASALGTVELVQFLGGEQIVDVALDRDWIKVVERAESKLERGVQVGVDWDADAVRLFDPADGRALDGAATEPEETEPEERRGR